jgi:hypothetical protein
VTGSSLRHPVNPDTEYRNPLGTVNRTAVETLDVIEGVLTHRGGVTNPLTGDHVPEERYARLMLSDIVAVIEGRI